MKKQYGQRARVFLRIAVGCSILLCSSGIVTVFCRKPVLGGIEIFLGAAALLTCLFLGNRYMRQIKEYVGMVTQEHNGVAGNILTTFPIPMVVLHIDGGILWYNEPFSAMFGNKNMFGMFLDTALPDLKWSEILKASSGIRKETFICGRRYKVLGNIMRNQDTSAPEEEEYSVYLYLIDETEEKQATERYYNEKTDVALILIDNYDEILQRMNDSEFQQVTFKINRYINTWVSESGGVVKKTDRDRYFVIFEHRYLQEYINRKFDLLEHIRNLGEEIHIPVTISIGIGRGGSVSENESYARNALDMALGRGGDQVSIKDDTQYKFYGGKTKEYEKSTRVKTRAVAVAVRDFIQSADRVFLMGHANADYDSFGAAVGLQRAVRALYRQPYIVYEHSPAVKNLMDEIKNHKEYDGMFIEPEKALELATEDSLVIVLDTHRPSMLPCPQLLGKVNKVVLIDHHRRATEFISPCSLVYHEPYASSTCEMVTEILQYIGEEVKINTVEAESLYMGILMDTKNFLIKTGVRTFEAASYLRRHGLNTVAVKKMFNVGKDDYAHRVDIVKTAEKVADNVAIAVSEKRYPNIRVIASQAADEILNIDNIEASFVLYPMENGVGISGRSLGDINVQLILESLGGGGHMTVAGAQLKNETVPRVKAELTKAVRSYLQEQ